MSGDTDLRALLIEAAEDLGTWVCDVGPDPMTQSLIDRISAALAANAPPEGSCPLCGLTPWVDFHHCPGKALRPVPAAPAEPGDRETMDRLRQGYDLDPQANSFTVLEWADCPDCGQTRYRTAEHGWLHDASDQWDCDEVVA